MSYVFRASAILLGLDGIFEFRGDQFFKIADLFLDILQRHAGIGGLRGAFFGKNLRFLLDPDRLGRRLHLFGDPFLKEFDCLFAHQSPLLPTRHFVAINVLSPEKDAPTSTRPTPASSCNRAGSIRLSRKAGRI